MLNDDLASRHEAAITAHLGVPGRMVGLSKSGYREAYPRHLAVFNSNVCFSGGKVWWGDVDLTIDEPSLEALAARTGETVYVLYELDGRFQHEPDPLLERAVYSVTPDGHTRFWPQYVERTADGRLYIQAPARPARFRRPARPRLWRFWILERVGEESTDAVGCHRSTAVYVGRRQAGPGAPLLVLAVHRWRRAGRGFWWEVSWAPSGHRCWAPSFGGRLKWHHGPVRPFISVRITPGVGTVARAGCVLGPGGLSMGVTGFAGGLRAVPVSGRGRSGRVRCWLVHPRRRPLTRQPGGRARGGGAY